MAAWYAALGPERTEQYLRDLKANDVLIVDGSAMPRDLVVQGEVPIGFTDTDDVNVAIQAGKPVGLVFPDKDGVGTLLIPNTVALIRGGPNPEPARRLIDYLLSRDVERRLAFSDSMQIPVRDGVERPAHVPSYAGIRAMDVDNGEIARNLGRSAAFTRELFRRRAVGLPRWAHAAIWVLFVAVVYLPLAQLGFESLIPAEGRDPGALRTLFLTDGQWQLLGTSILLAAGTALLAVVLGVPYALLCERTDLYGRPFFALAYLVPLLITPYMHAIVWGRLLANKGPVNSFFVGHLGLALAPIDIHSLGGAIFVLARAYFPFVTLLTLSGLKTLDRGYEEAALVQGSGLRTVLRVTLPMVRPHILAGALFVFVFSVIDFGVPDILRVQVYPVEIFVQFGALYDEQAAILLGFPLLVLTTVAIAFRVRSMRGRSYVSKDCAGVVLNPCFVCHTKPRRPSSVDER